MAKINWARVLLGGLVAGVICFIGDGLTHGLALKQSWMEVAKSLGKGTQEDPSAFVWYAIYDWHVRWKQPIAIGRDAGGRYTLPLTQTTLVMRPEQTLTFIGPPYDNK